MFSGGSSVSKYVMVSLLFHNIFYIMLLTYYNIKVKSLCVWGSQNFIFGYYTSPDI